jgi:predicted DNA-binding protein
MWIQKRGEIMSPKGRPTNEPKNLSTRIRLSDEDVKRLEFCCQETGLTKAEIIRQGIQTVYEKLKK